MSSKLRKSSKSSQRAAATAAANSSTNASIRPVIIIAVFLAAGIWAIYVNFYPSNAQNSGERVGTDALVSQLAAKAGLSDSNPAVSLGQISHEERTARLVKELTDSLPDTKHETHVSPVVTEEHKISKDKDEKENKPAKKKGKQEKYANAYINLTAQYDGPLTGLPVLGPVPTDGIKPLFGMEHTGRDAIFALACNYPKLFYQRFVGSLRKSGFEDDVVLAVSPIPKMKPGVQAYLRSTNVLSYAFDVDCIGKDNCKLLDSFLGYPDPRPHRTFANIRYALYEYWSRYYSDQSYILILDFRDTFFQGNPFNEFGPIKTRVPKYDLKLYAENAQVKNIGLCVYNSLWIGRCFGKPALEALKPKPVLCSGSTLGSYIAIQYYIRTMLRSMDSVQCWLKGIESDQGYQNYLYYNGHFNPPNGMEGNVTAFQQGEGIVNTIGALNGKRVPKEKKGPLDTFWHIRDEEGYILNNDGTRSICIHQWDRWYKDLRKFVDTKTF